MAAQAPAGSGGGRVLLLKGEPLAPGSDDAAAAPCYQLLRLPSPGTGQQQQYLLTASGLLELNRVKHLASCWLVGQTFVSDGNAFMATPVQVPLVLLALLPPEAAEGSGMFQELESLLCCEAWPDAQQLLGLAATHLPCLCDVRRHDSATYYRLHPQRVVAFLRLCVSQGLAAFQAASPASLAGLPQQEQQAYVLRFLREYVAAPWWDKLAASYGLSPAALNASDVPAARPVAPGSASQGAEKKHKAVDPKEAARKKAEESRAAAAAAKLQKQAAGTRKISAFFKPKK